jgi:predicted AlkP superfamily phosphohydrolase/phosphomutase
VILLLQMKVTKFFLFLLFASICSSKHVVLIGMDGCKPSGILNSSSPNLHHMISSGSYTFEARTVQPTVSFPGWASVLFGMGPEG